MEQPTHIRDVLDSVLKKLARRRRERAGHLVTFYVGSEIKGTLRSDHPVTSPEEQRPWKS